MVMMKVSNCCWTWGGLRGGCRRSGCDLFLVGDYPEIGRSEVAVHGSCPLLFGHADSGIWAGESEMI